MIKKGWSLSEDERTAYFNGGDLNQIFKCGKQIDEAWSYRIVVIYSKNGLLIRLDDDDSQYTSGCYGNIDIPQWVLSKLIGSEVS